MATPVISVCIPTYNFGRYIAQTLQSIVDQDVDGIEIVVVDGASTDNTTEVVQEFQRHHPAIRYVRLDRRGGIDRDMAKTVELATGSYCWLFSSDDLMLPGAIDRMLKEVKAGHDVYLCRHRNCSLNMDVLGEHPVLATDASSIFHLQDKDDRLRYFRLAANTEAFFSFMSGLVIRRDTWNSVALDDSFVGTCWAHAARLFEIAHTRLSVRYVPDCLLDRRGDNDSFADRGVVNRFRIAIEGYGRVAEHFFGSRSEEAAHIRRALRAEYRLRAFLYAKLLCRRSPATESRETLNALVYSLHRDRTIECFMVRAAYLAAPAWIDPLLRYARRTITRAARA